MQYPFKKFVQEHHGEFTGRAADFCNSVMNSPKFQWPATHWQLCRNLDSYVAHTEDNVFSGGLIVWRAYAIYCNKKIDTAIKALRRDVPVNAGSAVYLQRAIETLKKTKLEKGA